MAGATVPGRLTWRTATVAGIVNETARVRSIALDCPGWPGHQAGQHVDVRLTAEDGYQAERSYSIASAPEDERLVLTVERLEEGEVSPYLVDVLHEGDSLELRGPIGGHFVWTEALGGPLLLLAGGSGIVPLRAMLRHRQAVGSAVPVRLLYSARSLDEVIYRDELTRLGGREGIDVRFTLTRQWPGDWKGYRRRIDADLLRDVAWPTDDHPLVYICGGTGFVETSADVLVQMGHDPLRIRTERFGPVA